MRPIILCLFVAVARVLDVLLLPFAKWRDGARQRRLAEVTRWLNTTGRRWPAGSAPICRIDGVTQEGNRDE